MSAAALELLAALPRYETRKTVHAARIAWEPFRRPTFRAGRLEIPLVTPGGRLLYWPVSEKDESRLRAMKPDGGWFFVVYADGFVSCSPPGAFLASATRLELAP